MWDRICMSLFLGLTRDWVLYWIAGGYGMEYYSDGVWVCFCPNQELSGLTFQFAWVGCHLWICRSLEVDQETVTRVGEFFQ